MPQRTGITLRSNVFTIGFARRVATYKRADLLLTDPERLVHLAEKFRGMQILFSGKAHPHDEPGKKLIQEIFEVAAGLSPTRSRSSTWKTTNGSLGRCSPRASISG